MNRQTTASVSVFSALAGAATLMLSGFGPALAASDDDTRFTDLRFSATLAGRRGEISSSGVTNIDDKSAWDTAFRFSADWIRGLGHDGLGLALGFGVSYDDRSRTPQSGAGYGLPGYNGNQAYGANYQYRAIVPRFELGPYLRISRFLNLELIGHAGYGLATLQIENNQTGGRAYSDTAPVRCFGADLNLIFAESYEDPFLGVSFGWLGMDSKHQIKSPTSGTGTYHVKSGDINASFIVGYRF